MCGIIQSLVKAVTGGPVDPGVALVGQQSQPSAAPAAAAAAVVKQKPRSLLSASGGGDTSNAITSGGTAYGKTQLGA